jgi:membrane associated rhomboid family serine protease
LVIINKNIINILGSFFCSVFSLNHANKFYGDSNFFGASGSIASILTFFILNFPNEIIYVYFIPVPAWALGMFIFGYSIMNIDS